MPRIPKGNDLSSMVLSGKITLTPPMFADKTIPNGYLTKDRECHALYYYAGLATKMWDEYEKDPVFIEGRHPTQHNYRNVLLAVAQIYLCSPNDMIKYWSNVSMQFTADGHVLLPDEGRYRFNKPIVIKAVKGLQ